MYRAFTRYFISCSSVYSLTHSLFLSLTLTLSLYFFSHILSLPFTYSLPFSLYFSFSSFFYFFCSTLIVIFFLMWGIVLVLASQYSFTRVFHFDLWSRLIVAIDRNVATVGQTWHCSILQRRKWTVIIKSSENANRTFQLPVYYQFTKYPPLSFLVLVAIHCSLCNFIMFKQKI